MSRCPCSESSFRLSMVRVWQPSPLPSLTLAVDLVSPQHRGAGTGVMTLVHPSSNFHRTSHRGIATDDFGDMDPCFSLPQAWGWLAYCTWLPFRMLRPDKPRGQRPPGARLFGPYLGNPSIQVPSFIPPMVWPCFGVLSAFLPLLIRARGVDRQP